MSAIDNCHILLSRKVDLFRCDWVGAKWGDYQGEDSAAVRGIYRAIVSVTTGTTVGAKSSAMSRAIGGLIGGALSSAVISDRLGARFRGLEGAKNRAKNEAGVGGV